MSRRRADIIADALEELVFTGGFSDGDRLDEIRLARQFEVSRTPIREALGRLVASGLAEQIPRRGVLAAQRITEAALQDLDAANARCDAAIAGGDTDGYYRENEQFHHMIYHQAGNAFLEREALRLHRRLKPFRRMQLRLRGRMAQSMAEHEAVVSALRAGDEQRAAEVLRGHVAIQGEKFHLLMSSLRDAAE